MVTANKARILVVLAMLLAGFSTLLAAEFPNETLRYVITYKWGLISKDSGDAVLTLRNEGNNYKVTLTGKTRPWADKLYVIRDTLHATIAKNGFKPQRYTKIAHEGDSYCKDDIFYSYSGSNVIGKCARYRDKKGKIERSDLSLASTGETLDMLSIFYYLRQIDYSNLKKGSMFRVSMFSGTKKETCTVRILGMEKVTLRNKTVHNAWHIRFSFTSAGSNKSSEDIDAWISTAAPHIPLLLEGSLAVGKIKCYYTP